MRGPEATIGGVGQAVGLNRVVRTGLTGKGRFEQDLKEMRDVAKQILPGRRSPREGCSWLFDTLIFFNDL